MSRNNQPCVRVNGPPDAAPSHGSSLHEDLDQRRLAGGDRYSAYNLSTTGGDAAPGFRSAAGGGKNRRTKS